jgi:hypothetical protein
MSDGIALLISHTRPLQRLCIIGALTKYTLERGNISANSLSSVIFLHPRGILGGLPGLSVHLDTCHAS